MTTFKVAFARTTTERFTVDIQADDPADLERTIRACLALYDGDITQAYPNTYDHATEEETDRAFYVQTPSNGYAVEIEA